MASFDAIDDLITILKTVTMGNVTGLTTRPIIIKEGESPTSDGSGDLDSGMIVVNDEIMTEIDINKANIDEQYIIDAIYSMDAQSSDASFISMLAEIVRTLRVANQSSTRSYHYQTRVERDSNQSAPRAELLFTLTREWIDATT